MASPAATGSTAATDDEPQEAILLSHGAFNPVACAALWMGFVYVCESRYSVDICVAKVRRQHIDMMVQSRKRVEQAGYKVVGGILAPDLPSACSGSCTDNNALHDRSL